MQNNIQTALDSLGLSAQKRAIHVQFSNSTLNSQLFLQRIDGQDHINQGASAELICLSTNAHIALKQFIGSQVAVDTVTDRGELFRRTGIITQAAQGQSDGALTLYKLTVEDPTSLWKKRRNSRVFVSKSVVEVIETLFKEWQQNSPLFAASLSLDLSALQQDYDIRPFIMQSNETDHIFLTRLMKSEGINWLIDEAQLNVVSFNEEIQPQKLRLIDDNSQFQALSRRSVRFHRSSATELFDSMTRLTAQRSIQPTATHVQRWQPDALEQEEGAGSVQSKHSHSELYDNSSLALETAWHFSPAWMQDLNGEDQATASGNSQIEKINQHLADYFDSQAKQFVATTTVRDAQVGYWFELNEHPEIDTHSGADKEFLIIGKSFYNQNNLPKDLQDQVQRLLLQSQWTLVTPDQDERQSNQLTLQRRNIKLVPAYHPLNDRPMAHPQRAKVVGPSGETIHVDEWGRIKVRFMFTRPDDHAHDGGAGANNNDSDSAWVDVLTPWAGEGYGARFLPRVNEIVVIDFFDGNIDRPFVVGRLHEAERAPTQFDAKGALPDTKRLSGIRSKEIGGGGYGQLRFDDTTGQISTQLQSSHGASQLNLGKLSYPKEAMESDDRGQGFELRTDQWGAVRGAQGLLLTTYKQDLAKGDHLHAEDAKKQLESSQQSAKTLSEIAKNQQTNELESVQQLKSFAEEIQQDIAKFNKALLLLSSPKGIGLSTSEDIHLSADGQLNQFAANSINLSTQKNLITHASQKISLFAAQDGIKQVAAKGKFEIHAQEDALDIFAKSGIQIISTEDAIYITSPKEIVMKAGKSEIKLNGLGIFSTTNGKFEAKAGQHLFKNAANVSLTVPALPRFEKKNWIALEHVDVDQIPIAQLGYKIFFENNQIIEGRLDEQGKAHHENVPDIALRVEYEEQKTEPDKPWAPFSQVIEKLENTESQKNATHLTKNSKSDV